MIHIRTGRVVAIALCALAVAGTAAAEETSMFSLNPSGSFTLSSLGSITFASSAVTLTCPLTLNGEFERYVQLDPETEFGSVTRGTAGRCSSGSVAIETTNPWLIEFRSKLGTLPSSVTGILFRARDASFLFTVSILGFTARCKYTGNVGALMTLTGRGPFTSGLISLLAREQSYTLNSSLDTTGLCPPAESVSATGSLRLGETLTFQELMLGFQSIPAGHDFGTAGGDREFTFRNIFTGPITVTRVELQYGNRGWTKVSEECMMADGREKTIARDGICRARIRFVSGGFFAPWRGDILLVSSGAGGTIISGRAGFVGR